jgi:hypothetical protein
MSRPTVGAPATSARNHQEDTRQLVARIRGPAHMTISLLRIALRAISLFGLILLSNFISDNSTYLKIPLLQDLISNKLLFGLLLGYAGCLLIEPFVTAIAAYYHSADEEIETEKDDEDE